MNAFKSQQHRWAKGSIQVGLKLLPTILRSEQPLKVKLESFVHLTSNFSYVLMLIMSMMMPFALQIRIQHGLYEALLLDLPCFLGATVSVCMFYGLSQKEVGGSWKQRLLYVPAVLGVGIGLGVNNTKAVLEACFGHDSPFVRTPKLALKEHDEATTHSLRYRASRNYLPFIELSFALLYTYTVVYCIMMEIWFAIPFMMLFQWGFFTRSLTSIFQWSHLKSSTKQLQV